MSRRTLEIETLTDFDVHIRRAVQDAIACVDSVDEALSLLMPGS